ncbi:S-layer homology domain-containing protein [Paenibacillus radicis (ex Xue et al. 2023)]|uniref:S-layer homology domain-containing protein n=1 Tax=Paenibacillus radicis (ex Xue et al. 2023) TaxID=2972489 RepID=A0ABT1YJ30_9BACL|nr:S-layer homology domain-containing protein [Paenibacillus radicis (ex Xue et al. 2023)]MCR8633190.1 S-layer homology domain-containing protein [Paenibacillus radicis (ex Xue et al. 2023)]
MRKKRISSILLIVAMLVGMMPEYDLGSTVVQAAGADKIYLNENFNNSTHFPTGQAPNYADWSSAGNGVADTNFWSTTTTGGSVTVEDVPDSSNRSVKINRTSTSSTTKAESSLDFTSQPLKGLVIVEASVMSSGAMTGTQVAPYITNGAGSSIVKIQLNGGKIKANSGSTQQDVQAFTQGTWYDLKMVINTSSDIYDLYINGISKLTGQGLAAASGGSVGKVTFKMDTGNNTGAIYYDNLKVYTTTPTAVVTGLAFDSATYNVYQGDVFNAVVQAVYSDNSKQVLTSGNVFSSLNPTIASVDPSTGGVTARNQGTTQISVSNSVYGTPVSATVIVNPLPALTAPTGLSAGTVTGTLLQLNWSASLNAAKYYIYRAAAGSGLYSKVGESTTTTFTDNTVAASTAYDYIVSSVFTTTGGQVIESSQSPKVSVETPAASGFIVDDDFNGAATGRVPAGWTSTNAGSGTVAVAEVPSPADKSLSLNVKSKSDAAEADNIFPGITGKVAIEARIMTNGAQFSVSPYIYNNKDKAVMKFGLRNGYFVAIGASQQINTQPFVPNQWYNIKIIVNTNANTYDLWIDGAQQTVDRSDLVTPFDGTTNITRVMFKADNSDVSTSYVDNVKVYTLPPAQITGINFDQPAYTLYEGDTFNARVNTVDTDGAAQNVTSSSTYTSSNPSVAAIDGTGKITAIRAGTAQLNALYTVGQSVYQVQATVTVNSISALTVPQGLSVGAEWSTSITLNWTPAANVTKYSIYRAKAGDSRYSYVGQSQPGIAAYIDNSISPNTAYDYKVSSVFNTTGGQVIESVQSSKVTATSAAPPVNFPTAATGFTVKDDFNRDKKGDTPNGWVADTSGGTVSVQEVPFPVDKSVMITKSTGTNAATAARKFSSLNGTVTIEAKVKAMETAGTKYIPYIYDGNGNTIAAIAFKDGNIVYNKNGSLTNTGVSFNADKWYIVRAVIDTGASKYDLYIDGMKKVGGISLLAPASDVGKISFGIDAGNTGTLYFDNVKVYSQAAFIGGPPAPVFDVKNYGAIGDGLTKDTAAIQAAIEEAAGTGGSVYLHDGIFLSGMIQLKSNMTFYIDSTATLKGSSSTADYPDTNPLTYNTQLGPAANCNKALIYADHVENVTIDGGGTIDGSGDSFAVGSEPTRPMAIYTVLSSNVTMQNLYIKKSGMWTVVNAETDYLIIRNIYLDVKLSSNRDGFDIVDSHHVLIEEVTVNTGDDAICIKSGKRRGVEDVLVRNSNVTASGTNGLKFGTASYGAFKNVRFEDIMVKGVKYCAMCVESVDGADVTNITFQRIDVQDAGNPFFVILAKRSDRTTKDDKAKKGTMDTVRFQDIIGKNMNTSWASPISGANMSDGTNYRLKNIYFDNVNMTYKGGRTTVPGNPSEYALGQYPESNIWGDLPAYGYYVRHADGVLFTNSTTNVSPSDAREPVMMVDAFNSTGIVLGTTGYSLHVGEAQNIKVTQSYENGDTLDVTGSSTFASSDTSVATVDASGKITAVRAGSSVITVTNRVYEAVANVTVLNDLVLSSDAALRSLIVTPDILTPLFDKETTNYTANVGYAVSAVTIAPIANSAYAAIAVNGVSTESGGNYSANLNFGANTISVVVTAQDGTTKTYVLTITRRVDNSSNRSSNNEPSTQTVTIDPTALKVTNVSSAINVDAVLDKSTGTAKAEISAADLKNALEKAAADHNGVKTVKIQVPKVDGTKVYEPVLPASYVTNGDKTQKIAITTPFATIELPGNLLKPSEVSASSTISFPVEFVVKETIGDRPILDLQMRVDGQIVKYDNPEAAVTISMPFKPSDQEMKDPEHIIVLYLDGDGNAVKVPNGKYDTATGKVTFKTTHFGKYAPSFDYKTFDDISSYGWAKKQIEVLASKGVISGTSDITFSPAESITRADFLVLLVRTLGISADIDGNFSDVSKSDYFYQELGIARKVGISDGIGENWFNPQDKISRQDMIVLCANALQLTLGSGEHGSTSDLEPFKDKSDVASYAKESVASMVKGGIVTGDGSHLNPRGNTTRAEAAVIMYRMFNKQ